MSMPSRSPQNILVVDDDPILGHLFTDILEMAGHRCTLARNGPEALEQVSAGGFDLVISDLKMPGMSGKELWERLGLAHPHLAATMIFVSAEQRGASSCEFLERSGHRYLQKPFNIPDLLHVIEQPEMSLAS